MSILAEKEIRAMLLSKYPMTGLGLVLCLSASAAIAPIPPMASREGVIILTYTQAGPPGELLTPSGRELGKLASGAAKRQLTWPQAECPLINPRLSPDAKRILAVKIGFSGDPHELWIFDPDSKDGPNEPLLSDLHRASAVWSRDGSKLYGSSVMPGKESDPYPKDGSNPLACWTFDVKTRKKTPLAIPIGHEIVDLSPDGQTLLTKCVIRHNDLEKSRRMATFLVPLDTLKPKQLVQQPFGGMRFSPNGKQVLGIAPEVKNDRPHPWKPAICTIADDSLKFIRVGEEVASVFYACWSPDGKRIAMVWQEKAAPPKGAEPPRRAWRVTVCDPGGGNANVIARREWIQNISGVDWK